MSTKRSSDRTASIRIREDLAIMISWITRIRNATSADILDPLIRPVIQAKYAELLPAFKAMKQAEDEARESAGEPITDPLPEVNVIELPASGPIPEIKTKPKCEKVLSRTKKPAAKKSGGKIEKTGILGK